MENIIIFIPNKLINFNYKEEKDIEKFLKDKIIKLKKKYHKDISGFYNVNVYQNNKYGLIIELIHESDIDFFKDLIDIKVNVYYDSDIYLELDDYFLIEKYKNKYFYNNKYYISIDDIPYIDIIALSDFYKYIYGNKLISIKNQFKVLN